MKKFSIGFNADAQTDTVIHTPTVACEEKTRPSMVFVYFPHRNNGWTYYNDSFDLKVGDWVYVEGKLEGYKGRITEVNYSFKIKISDYKRVIARIDTDISGDFKLTDTHLVTLDRDAIPYEKIKNWYNAPQFDDEEFAVGNDDTTKILLDDLSKIHISACEANKAQEYYIDNKVSYICVDGIHGRAIIEVHTENYEVEFNYINGCVSNLKCQCYCSGVCKHILAALLQLRDIVKFIQDNYADTDYFAAISKEQFVNAVMKNSSGSLCLHM